MGREIVKLDDLATSINAAHQGCLVSAENAVRNALECGRLLTEARALLRHGEWYPWIEANCSFKPRQASKYILAHKNKALVEAQIGTGGADLDGLRSALRVIAEAREDQSWSRSEQDRRRTVEAGHSVTANMGADHQLIEWAKKNAIFVPIDRNTDWGNPFIIDEDGERDEIIDAYQSYLAYKPSLQRRLEELRGKVLGCWCHPEACHGDVLIREVYQETAPDEAQRVGCHG